MRSIESKVLLAIAATLPLVTGCVLSRMEDYEFNSDMSGESGVFVPYVYIEENESKLPLPQFIVIDWPKPPHDLVMLLFDQTYRQTSDGFKYVVVESMELAIANASPIALVSPDARIEERTFTVAQGKTVFSDAAIVRFDQVIVEDSFVVTVRGYAIDQSGERFPFHRRTEYIYNGRQWFWGPYSV